METSFSVRLGNVLIRGSTHHAGAAPTPRVIALHGGGAMTTHRGMHYLRHDLAAGHGVATSAFDFSGHGLSSGRLHDSSLHHRAEQALHVAGHLEMRRPLALLGTSMGGHVACSLIDALAPAALLLYCPAAYEEAALHARFGPAFQSVIRATPRFDTSPAFSALERFTGRLLIVQGTEDAVIPDGVQHGYQTRAIHAKSVEVIRLRGAGHRLHDWLRCRPLERERVLRNVVATIEAAAQDG